MIEKEDTEEARMMCEILKYETAAGRKNEQRDMLIT
jgi:hypothetical protein